MDAWYVWYVDGYMLGHAGIANLLLASFLAYLFFNLFLML